MKLQSSIDGIKISPHERRGDPQVQLVGGLAAILELAVSRQQKTAIQMDSGVGRIFMVAGAGFEPRSTHKQNRFPSGLLTPAGCQAADRQP